MSTLYLVRHGQASFGQPDYDLLSSLGERQVGLLRDHLHGVAEAPHALYSGTLRRQRDTARILAAPTCATVTELDGLNEYRVAAAIGEVMAREGRSRRVVVSTSAGVVGAAVGHLLGLPPREAVKLSWSVHNSSVTRIQYDGARTSLSSFNTVPHLEHPERRSLLTYR